MSKMLREAEKAVVNRAVQLRDIMKVLDAFASFGNRYFRDYSPERENFHKGLQAMRRATQVEFGDACCNLVAFIGTGGEEAKKFSQDEFKRYFDEKHRYTVMHFLKDNGAMPSSWMSDDEQALRQEAKDVIESFETSTK